jgi:hypothetical protein
MFPISAFVLGLWADRFWTRSPKSRNASVSFVVSACSSVSPELKISMVSLIGQAARKRRTHLMNCVLLPGASVMYECV